MLKTLLRSNIFLVFSVGILTLNSAIMARMLGVDGRADFYYLFLPLYFAPAICGGGAAQLGIYISKKNSEQCLSYSLLRIAKNSFGFSIAWSFVFITFFIDYLEISILSYFVITIIACTIFSIATYINALSCIDKSFFLPDIAKILTPCLNLSSLIYLYYSGGGSPLLLITLQTIVRCIEILVCFFFIKSIFDNQEIIKIKKIKTEYNKYAKRAWHVALNSLLFLHLDKLLVLQLATKEQLGYFAVASGLAMNVSTFVGNITNIFISKVDIGSQKKLFNSVIKVAWYYFISGALVLFFSYIFLDYVIILIFGQEFAASAHYLNILLLKIFFSSISWLTAQCLILSGDNKRYIKIQYLGLMVVITGVLLSAHFKIFDIFLWFNVLSSFVCYLMVVYISFRVVNNK